MEEQTQAVESVETEVQESVNTDVVADDQPIVESETETATEQIKPEITSLSDGMLIDLGDGEPITAEEAKKRFMLHSDYTRKTQEVAEQRKALELEQQELAPARDHMRFIQENPYLIQTFNQLVDAWRNGEVVPIEEALNSEAGPYLNHLMARVNELETELNRVNGESQDFRFSAEMNNILSDLKAEFKGLITPEYEQSLRQEAKEQGLSADAIKRMARGDLLSQKSQQDKTKIEAETIKKIQQNAISSPGSLAQEGAEHTVSYSQMSAADKKALRERVLRGEHVQL